ncbi:MAG: flagellar hook assembly protein FlgD [Desulfobulbaceae bacterium]|nr:flagellar hook assembly protein FlgD [Desulfobulbaceae bacterium]
MTYIPGISQSYTTQNQSQPTETKGQTLGQDDFLTLLVAQLQNQDPLNPTDATEFTAQLAQFSQLEQLFNLNDSMEQLATAQNNSERLSALSLIGKEVLVEGSSFELGEDTAQIGYKVDGTAANVSISIQNSQGQTVATLAPEKLTEGNHFITWNGFGRDGEHLPAGTYDIVINAQSSGEGATVAVSPLVRSEVTGVDLSGEGALLITRTGEFNISDIQGVYDKSSENYQPEEGEETSEEEMTTQETVSAATDGAGIIEDAVSADSAQSEETAGA